MSRSPRPSRLAPRLAGALHHHPHQPSAHPSPPASNPLADCHSHLDRYPTRLLGAMTARAAAAGVRLILTAGADVRSSRRGVELTARFPTLRAAVGLHPLHVRGPVPDRTFAALDRLAAAPEVVAWSECGLDYRDGRASPTDQRAAFQRQLLLARAQALALIVHVVAAAADALALLEATNMAHRAAVHYFVGGPALAERYLTAGLYLSVGKPVTRAENAALRDAIHHAPLDRLLLETDTYPLPDRTTEPADVRLVAAAVAQLHAVSPATVAAATSTNLARLLGPRLCTALA